MAARKRYVYMDVLRIAACLCVIYNHVNEYGFYMFAYRQVGSCLYCLVMMLICMIPVWLLRRIPGVSKLL